MQNHKELEALSNRAQELCEYITSEEGSKTSLVLPLLSILGYDVFNPKQISAEFVADVGIKRGEKVDYAIMSNGTPKLLIECKTVSDPLEHAAVSQLFRYYSTTEAKFGVLTNGLVYKFYTDIDVPNRMDLEPFFVFNLRGFTYEEAEFLFRFRKGSLAGEMKSLVKDSRKRKLMQYIRTEIHGSLSNPEFIVTRLKTKLESTNLSSVSKKELEAIVSGIAVEESISCLAKSLIPSNLKPKLDKLLKALLGEERMGNLVYKETGSSIYVETDLGAPLLRIFSNNLDLRFSLLGSASSQSLYVLDDLARHGDLLLDAYREAIIQPRD